MEKIKRWVIEKVLWAENNLQGKSGAEKKAAVIKKLDEMITLPSYLEWVDDMVLSYLVNQACEELNKITAHNFKDVELNEVDKGKIAKEMSLDNAE